MKNLEFLSNQADIQGLLPTHELVILTKFRKDWQKIEDFLIIAKFCASLIFSATVSMYGSRICNVDVTYPVPNLQF